MFLLKRLKPKPILILIWLAFFIVASFTVFMERFLWLRESDARAEGLVTAMSEGGPLLLSVDETSSLKKIANQMVERCGLSFLTILDKKQNRIVLHTLNPELEGKSYSHYEQDYIGHLTNNIDPSVHTAITKNNGQNIKVFAKQIVEDGELRGVVVAGISTTYSNYFLLAVNVLTLIVFAFMAFLSSYGLIVWQKEQNLERQKLNIRAEEEALIARDEERRRISRELHDNLAQLLASISLRTSNLASKLKKEPSISKQLSRIAEVANSGVNDLRNYILTLRDKSSSVLNFTSLLTDHMKMFENAADMQIKVNLNSKSSAVPRAHIWEIIRIIDEALRNVQKHSGVKSATIFLSGDEKSMYLSIKDEGRGFVPGEVFSKSEQMKKFGIESMKERAENLGGKFEIQSAPGKGTEILIQIPKKVNNRPTDSPES